MVKNLLNLFFPEVCNACSNILTDNELQICTSCRHNLPITDYHFTNPEFIKKLFYGRLELENATALFRFQKKGITQQLMHNLKYRGHENIGAFLGRWLGNEINTIESYKDIDVIIPVPLHKSKFRKRGYNQVTKFGEEIALALGVDFNESILVKNRAVKTQVFKKRLARWSAIEEVFNVSEIDTLQNKHILLVDDIITTGATMEACANQLNKIPNMKLSIAAMAIA